MKSRRQEKIIELINKEEIETQEALAQRLNELGFRVTQATVSRDIRELKLTKISMGPGTTARYASIHKTDLSASSKYMRVLKDGYVSMDHAQNILVIKTVSGMAMAVAAALDAMEMNEIVGCIAGDDTVFCAVRTVSDTVEVMNQIREIIDSGLTRG